MQTMLQPEPMVLIPLVSQKPETAQEMSTPNHKAQFNENCKGVCLPDTRTSCRVIMCNSV